MNLTLVTKNKKIGKWVKSHIGYYADGIHHPANSMKASSGKQPFVLIVARQHYSESWQTYPSVNKKELNDILGLRQAVKSNLKVVDRIFENKTHDGFDVKSITFDQQLESLTKQNVVLIPETELLTSTTKFDGNCIFELETLSGTLYCSRGFGKNSSAYKKGIIQNINGFSMSAGLPADIDMIHVEQAKYFEFLLQCLELTNLDELAKISSFNVTSRNNFNKLHALYIGPLATVTLLLLVVNGYYFWQEQSLKDSIAQSQVGASSVLLLKQNVDELNLTIQSMNKELAVTQLSYPQWKIVDVASKNGMEISRFTRNEKGIEVRGVADKASAVLASLNDLPEVEEANFVGAVRKSRGRDLFKVLLQYKGTTNNE